MTELLFSRLLLLAVLAVNMAGLWPELSISRVDLNDNVSHFAIARRMVQAVERGENPLDCWSPEVALGYPVLRVYQALAHALVAAVYFALAKTVSLMTVFVWIRFLCMLLLPASFFACARSIGLSPSTAAAAALLAPLLSTHNLYGLEYGSYVWAGSGLFPQSVAAHLFLWTIGVAFGALRRGGRLAIAGILLGLTFLTQFIYGYMAAVTICLLALIGDTETPRPMRIRRAAGVGLVALVVSAFQLAPLALDGFFINRSRWEPLWKLDSFGASQVLAWLFTGELLDHGRAPVLTLLALLGAGLYVWKRRSERPADSAHALALLAGAFWIGMFFGRPFWGGLLWLAGVTPDLPLHRVIGGAQVFLTLLGAIGLAALWRELSRRWSVPAAAAATALLLYPAASERARYLASNVAWGRPNLEAWQAERSDLDTALARVKERGGRVYPGLAGGWGGSFRIGSVPFYAFLSGADVPAVAFLYHSLSLTSDLMVRFNEWNPAHYRIFGIRTVVAPADRPLPAFLAPLEPAGRFRLFDAPGGGYFDLVDVPASVETTRANFYDVNDRWLGSDWAASRLHLLLDFRGESPVRLPRLDAGAPLPKFQWVAPPAGQISSEQRTGEVYAAQFETARPCFVLFKMTYHPGWKAYVDGRAEKTVMLSPGFMGVLIKPGQRQVLFRYEPGMWKAWTALTGFSVALLLVAIEARRA